MRFLLLLNPELPTQEHGFLIRQLFVILFILLLTVTCHLYMQEALASFTVLS